MGEKTEKTYLYDAFISYRHVPLDKAVAVRLQELLESYRPPKASGQNRRIKRIFRDQSELPGSGDLGGEIRQALMASEYLVVVCSSETKKSAWCLEEIRQFKEVHNGRTDHILVVLTEGNPDEVFPEELLHETYSVVQEDGTVVQKERQLVPLSGDVRADSIKQSLKALKTEFLRIAAPILGCRFDDLYQRHLRRKRRRFAAIMGGSFGLLSAVLILVSIFAYRTFLSEKNYRMTLADSYTRQGTARVQEGELQEALLYFSEALELEPETQTGAKMGASLLLEQYAWPCLVREETGMILGNVEIPNPPDFYVQASDREGSCFLKSYREYYALLKADGTEEALPQEIGEFIGSAKDGSVWTFCNEDQISCFDTETKEWRKVPRPREISPFCREDNGVFELIPAAFPVSEDRIMVVYGGYVYLYEDRNGSSSEIVRVDLANVFPEEAKQQDLYIQGVLWVSDDKSLAVVESGFGIAAFDTSDLSVKMAVLRYRYMLNDVAFSKDGKSFGLAFGNPYGSYVNTPGGYLEIFNQQGDKLFETEENLETPFEGLVFHDADSGRLLAWSSGRLHFFDIKAEEEYGVPMETETIDRAVFADTEHCVCFDGSETLRYYNLVEFQETKEVQKTASVETLEEVSMEGMAQAFPLGNGLVAAHNYTKVYLLKDTGEILDEVRLDYVVNQMTVDASTGEVYLFFKYEEYFYRTKVLSGQNCLDKVVRLNTRGEAVIGLYPLQGRMAALTGTNQILFYSSQKSEPEMAIRLKHNGTVRDIKEGAYKSLGVTVRMVAGSIDSYHYSTADVVEVWDGVSGLYIMDLEAEHEWLIETTKPAPDQEAIKFLQALTCCAFDEAQNVVTKSPVSLSMGNWDGELHCEEVPGIQRAKEPALSEEKNELAGILETYREGPKEGEEAQWFADCDKVWTDLCEKKISYNGPALEEWFSLYYSHADNCGYIEHIETGIKAYLEMMIELTGSEEEWLSQFDSYMIELASRTESYDSLLGEGFQILSDKQEQELEPEDDLYMLNYYMVYWLRCYAELLNGKEVAAFGEIDKAKEEGVLPEDVCIMTDIVSLLCKAQVQEAVTLTMRIVDLGAGDASMEHMLVYILEQEYVFMKRGAIEEETMEAYLSLLPADLGIEVLEVSSEAQKAGLLYGDLIVAVNGRHVSCRAHFQALPKESATLEIIRDGEKVLLEKDGVISFGGRFRIIFKGDE